MNLSLKSVTLKCFWPTRWSADLSETVRSFILLSFYMFTEIIVAWNNNSEGEYCWKVKPPEVTSVFPPQVSLLPALKRVLHVIRSLFVSLLCVFMSPHVENVFFILTLVPSSHETFTQSVNRMFPVQFKLIKRLRSVRAKWLLWWKFAAAQQTSKPAEWISVQERSRAQGSEMVIIYKLNSVLNTSGA